ncbi:MAG: hypothetical protein IPO85_14165 [Saprospiraceae bacterium]|uniref:Membrane-anchored protein n=1 Tax=Candidatus Defluviibacterium haderslevense TaxID=2981993 RepID=A0A9D7SBJ1_9BACT|nr:hypothetical protein [Candidatus Defluviibacterium haderslevense]
MNKLPQISFVFWVMKICATTLGETAGDLLSMTLNIGYAYSSILLVSIFLTTLVLQIKSTKYLPFLYWSVILATSTAGTTMSDFMDRTLGLGYSKGSLILTLVAILIIWKQLEKTISVTNIMSKRGELFYWSAILISNTLGTAMGDFLADDSGLGFMGGAFLISFMLILTVIVYYTTQISRVLLFWIAFILTRPFGATFGDVLTKPLSHGGLNFGTIGSSLILFIILIGLIFTQFRKNKFLPSEKIKLNNIFL